MRTASPKIFNARILFSLLALTAAFLLPSHSAAQESQGAPVGSVAAASEALPPTPSPTHATLSMMSAPLADANLPEPDLSLQTDQTNSPAPRQQLPPSSSAPTLGDLGLTPDQVKPDPDMQARLDRRTHMLKVHQRLGLITLAPLAAACISSAAAPPDPRNGSGNTVGRDIHLSLGSLSVAMYGATAYYAIRAPRVGDTPARGGIKLHKYLIYIHAPGMILTPILGAMAFNQANNGERVHGIASAHAAVAWTTVASYTAAIVAVSWPIHLKL